MLVGERGVVERNVATTAGAKVHNQWLRAKIEVALTSRALTIPHDQVMVEPQGILDVKRGAAPRPARQNASQLI